MFPLPSFLLHRHCAKEASFEELHDMDHFEILWNLTQEDYVLTQVGCIPSL